MNLRQLYESGKAVSFVEAQKDLELVKHVQKNLIRLGLLEPPADGQLGPITIATIAGFQAALKILEQGIGIHTCKALIEVRSMPADMPLHLVDESLASSIAKYYKLQGWYFSRNSSEINICYLEGANADGRQNTDAPNEWNDRRIIWSVRAGIPTTLGNWQASCEPGWWHTLNPMNPDGCARIKNPAHFRAWRIGFHGGAKPHPALVQVAPVEIFRDSNKDMSRTGDRLHQGLFGINQHWGYGMQFVDRASAGCMAAPDWEGHLEFIAACKSDRRYKLNPAYTFSTAFIPGDKLNFLP